MDYVRIHHTQTGMCGGIKYETHTNYDQLLKRNIEKNEQFKIELSSPNNCRSDKALRFHLCTSNIKLRKGQDVCDSIQIELYLIFLRMKIRTWRM